MCLMVRGIELNDTVHEYVTHRGPPGKTRVKFLARYNDTYPYTCTWYSIL